MKLALCMGFIWPVKPCSLSFDSFNEAKIMTASRRVIKFTIGKADLSELESIARSRTEPVGRVERARVLLAYRQDPSFYAVGQALGMHHQKVQRYIERAKAEGALAALDERARPGKEPTITVEAKTWVVALACRKAKELGYPHEVWTTRLLARHAREHGPAEGHSCLSGLAQGTVCKILDAQEVKPHKVRYYLERRDPQFKAKMAQVLCVYSKVNVLKKAAATAAKKNKKPSEAVTVISYDEKPGIQAIATTAPDLPPEPGVHPTLTAIRLILDNHSAHISKETNAWLAARPGRFEFTFTPKHGSWLNLVEGFFSKFARSVLRHIRVASKQELKDRIMAAMDHFNENPVVHTWSYKLKTAA